MDVLKRPGFFYFYVREGPRGVNHPICIIKSDTSGISDEQVSLSMCRRKQACKFRSHEGQVERTIRLTEARGEWVALVVRF